MTLEQRKENDFKNDLFNGIFFSFYLKQLKTGLILNYLHILSFNMHYENWIFAHSFNVLYFRFRSLGEVKSTHNQN